MAVKPQPDSRYSRSLEYGLAILESFDRDRHSRGIAKLADALNISRSTSHRYASTLVALGYLEQDARRQYLLSHRAAGPGMGAIEILRLETPSARRILEDLRKDTGHTVSMGVLDGTRVIYMHRLFAHKAGQYEADLGLGVGAHVPPYCTAIGKALLASLSEPEQCEILANLTLKREGPKTIVSERVLADQLSSFRAGGLAVCDEEQARGVRSIASAIPRPGRSKPIAVSVTVPADQYPVKRLAAMFGPHVKAAAERI